MVIVLRKLKWQSVNQSRDFYLIKAVLLPQTMQHLVILDQRISVKNLQTFKTKCNLKNNNNFYSQEKYLHFWDNCSSLLNKIIMRFKLNFVPCVINLITIKKQICILLALDLILGSLIALDALNLALGGCLKN